MAPVTAAATKVAIAAIGIPILQQTSQVSFSSSFLLSTPFPFSKP